MSRRRPPRAAGPESSAPQAASVDPFAGAYYTWRTVQVEVRGEPGVLAVKPGLAEFAAADPAARLLVETVEAESTDVALDLSCGAGLVGLALARRATRGRVTLADANILAAEAARRTIAANGLTNARAVADSPETARLGLGGSADLVVVRAPREKLVAIRMMREAFLGLRVGGRLYLAGANDEGIKPLLRQTEELFGDLAVVAYGGGARVGLATRPADPLTGATRLAAEWLGEPTFHAFEVSARGRRFAVRARPGVFAWDRLDAGSRALIEAMDIHSGETVLDLGCGHGIVGAVAATLSETGAIYLVDADLDAVESARRTVEANGLTNCRVLASDCASAVREVRFDVVVANPPFHLGRATTFDVANEFVDEAAAILKPGGRLYLVANQFLGYHERLERLFATVETAQADRQFTVLLAGKGR